jgi:hypothetical protein
MVRRRPATAKLVCMMPKGVDALGGSPRFGPSVREQWVRWRDVADPNGRGFDVTSLGFVVDTFTPLVEA